MGYVAMTTVAMTTVAMATVAKVIQLWLKAKQV